MRPRRIEQILAELDTVVMPGIVHWGHPAFLGYFGSTSNGPRSARRDVAAALNVSAMTWQTSPAATELETVVLGWIRRWSPCPTRSRASCTTRRRSASCTRSPRRERAAASRFAREGVAGRADVSGPSRVRLRPGAQLDREGDDRARARRRPTSSGSRATRRSGSTSRRCATSDRRTMSRAGYRPMAVVATVGTTSTTSVDPVAGSRPCAVSTASGCTWTRRTVGRWRSCPKGSG